MKKSFSNKFINWLKSTELFARPSKQIVGEWQLVEYYVDTEDKLINISEKQLKDDDRFWRINFLKEKYFRQQNNLNIKVIENIENGNWETTRNFVMLYGMEKLKQSFEFQFAIERDQLKLLKKDKKGRIEFFGFFTRINE